MAKIAIFARKYDSRAVAACREAAIQTAEEAVAVAKAKQQGDMTPLPSRNMDIDKRKKIKYRRKIDQNLWSARLSNYRNKEYVHQLESMLAQIEKERDEYARNLSALQELVKSKIEQSVPTTRPAQPVGYNLTVPAEHQLLPLTESEAPMVPEEVSSATETPHVTPEPQVLARASDMELFRADSAFTETESSIFSVVDTEALNTAAPLPSSALATVDSWELQGPNEPLSEPRVYVYEPTKIIHSMDSFFASLETPNGGNRNDINFNGLVSHGPSAA